MGNLAHSILDRLLSMTRQNGWNFTEVLVRRTFERRQTPLPNGLPTALTDEFASNSKKIAQWKGFCRKSRIETIPLPEVLAQLADKVDKYELFTAQTS